MIRAFSMENLRGVRRGGAEGLFPLTVLLGPNNSGKSTCLEALSILHAPSVAVGLQLVLRRRGWFGLLGARVMIPPPSCVLRGTLERAGSRDGIRTIQLLWVPIIGAEAAKRAREDGLAEPFVELDCHESWQQETASTSHGSPSKFFINGAGQTGGLLGADAHDEGRRVVLLDAHTNPAALEESLGLIDGAGENARLALLERLRAIDADLRDVRAKRDNGAWVPHATYDDRSVPLAVAGDGMKRLFDVACRLAVLGDGLALIEEPECFQHPKSLEQLVRVLWASVDAGGQIVLSTHSMELFDHLSEHAQAGEARLARFGVLRTALKNGVLETVRVPGDRAITLRRDLAEDLR